MLKGSLKNLFSFFFSFKGRIKRKAFIYGTVISAIVFLTPFILIAFISLGIPLFFIGWGFFPISGILLMLSTYVSLALTVKRLRDCNYPLWLLLIYLIPCIGIGFWIVLTILLRQYVF